MTVEAETIYTGAHEPDPSSAVDVLAFIFTPMSCFEAGARAMVVDAKHEAARNWQRLQNERQARG